MSKFRSDQFNLQPVDLSGLYRGIGQLGQGVASGIASYRRDKEEKKLTAAFEDSIDKDGNIDLKAFTKKVGESGSKLSTDDLQRFTALAQQQNAMNQQRLQQQAMDADRQQRARREDEKFRFEQDKAQRDQTDARNKADAESAQAWYSMDPSRTPAEFRNMDPNSVMKGYAAGSKEALDRRNTESLIAQREKEEEQTDSGFDTYAEALESVMSSAGDKMDVSSVNISMSANGKFLTQATFKTRDGTQSQTPFPFRFTEPSGAVREIMVAKDDNGKLREIKTQVPVSDIMSRNDYGEPAVNAAIAATYGFFQDQAQPQPGQMPVVASDEDYQRLPVGAQYTVEGDSKIYTKQ